MQCPCGGEATANEAIKKRFNARLEFSECRSCGRVGSSTLHLEDVAVEVDSGAGCEAREEFLKLTKERAGYLYRKATQPSCGEQVSLEF